MIGLFDNILLPSGWFDETLIVSGWFDNVLFDEPAATQYFGKSDIGATQDIISGDEYIQCRFNFSVDAYINSIEVYTGLPYHTGTKNVSYSIFSDNAGDPGSEIISPSGTIEDPIDWYSITGLNEFCSAGYYWLGFWCEVHMYAYRDAGASGQSRRKYDGAAPNDITFDTWVSPWNNTNIDSQAYEWSIRVTYTEAGTGIVRRRLLLMGVGN